jgi:hypothetical protein
VSVLGTATVAGGGVGLARTGFPVVGATMIAIALLVTGLALVRMAMLRRTRSVTTDAQR